MERLLFEILVYNKPIDKFNSYWEEKVNKFRRNETDEEWEDKKVNRNFISNFRLSA